VTDGRARDGTGQQVAGDGPDTFNGVCDVAIGRNGDIFATDGHVNARVVKFNKDGKFIKMWGSKGTGHGQFDLRRKRQRRHRPIQAGRRGLGRSGRGPQGWDLRGGDCTCHAAHRPARRRHRSQARTRQVAESATSEADHALRRPAERLREGPPASARRHACRCDQGCALPQCPARR
jgi:hypothetical protein